jgi:hypothetical protein
MQRRERLPSRGRWTEPLLLSAQREHLQHERRLLQRQLHPARLAGILL